MRKNGIVIAIDGPAGVGKSTLSKIIADRYNYIYLNTGAMYRAVALSVTHKKINLDDEKKIIKIAGDIDIAFSSGSMYQKVYVDLKDVTSLLKGEDVGKAASIVSKMSGVRDILVERQKHIGKDGGVVMEGRDIGTVVFCDAEVKFFISASVEARAERRHRQLNSLGSCVDIVSILKSIKDRDNNDTERDIAPLKKAEDAILIDTTVLSIDEVVKIMVKHIDYKLIH